MCTSNERRDGEGHEVDENTPVEKDTYISPNAGHQGLHSANKEMSPYKE